MTSQRDGRNTSEAWFSVLEGAAPTFNQRLVALWQLTPEERAQLSATTGGAAVAALLSFMARRATDPALVLRLIPPDHVLAEAVVQAEVALRDGRTVEILGSPIRAAHGGVIGRMVLHRNVTRHRRDEAELRDQARRQVALARLARVAAAAESIDPLLETAVAIVAETLATRPCAVMEVTPEGDRLYLRAGVGWPGATIGTAVATGPRVRAALTLLAAGPLVAVDTGAGVTLAGEAPPAPANVGAAALVQGRDGPYGMLTAYGEAGRPFGREDLAFLETAAGVLGSALGRHQAEAAARERDAIIRAMFDRSRDAILVADSSGEILDANPAACAALDRPQPELIGLHLPALLRHGDDDGDPRSAWEGFLAGGRRQAELELPRPDQRPDQPPKSFEYSALADIVPERHLVIMRDVTERRQLTARLALADRMASVGTMAAGVAHELNNPLAYISANLAYVGDGLAKLATAVPETLAIRESDGAPLVHELQRAIDEAREGSERMRVIIRDLLALSRSDESSRGPVDVAEVIDSCIHIAGNEIRQRATLEKVLGDVPPVVGNAARLSQVFLNLLVNAAQAIPEGGAGAHRIRVASSRADDGRVVVEVSDTGEGIRPEHLSRVFDPFFTTKPIGVGTGLGLAICHNIVSSYGGDIEVQSEPGRGTTFRVLLVPATAGAAEAEVVAPGAPRGGVARHRILVIDDEPLVGAALRRALGGEHDVEVAASAVEALARLGGGERFDLVLSDLLMPEMTGMDLHCVLSVEAPALVPRMMFLTGGAFTPAARSFVAEHRDVCIEKPFQTAALRDLVRRRLAELRGAERGDLAG